MSESFAERDKVAEVQATERLRINANAALQMFYISAGILGGILLIAAVAFFVSGEKTLLTTAIAGTFGFLAGLGFSKFSEKK